jgi:putative Mg2+ transporter-C (MgtC) family protein
VLSALIGLEREIRQKNAGLRTHTLVGFAAALFVLVSKYGFTDVLANGTVVLDPSRVAAQVVTGIGFIGGGVIFVRKDLVRGLTTAAIIWLTAAVGMACGAGLPILAVSAFVGHFAVMFVFPALVKRLPRSRWAPSSLRVSYIDGRGLLRDILVACTRERFSVSRVEVDKDTGSLQSDDNDAVVERIVTVTLEIVGSRSIAQLVLKLTELKGVVSVRSGDSNVASE